MKTTVTFLLCWLGAAGAAQPLVWQGIITHAQTKQPVEHVNIYAPQNDIGAVSDATGRFSISLEKLPDTLVISCIGFATVKWPLRSTSAAFLTVALEPQSGLLPEVSVSAIKKAAIIYPPEYSVVDYELYEGVPLLLVYKNSLSGYWLVALDEQDQVRGELRLKRLQPEALIKSCLGGVYLLLDNGAHVIKVVNGTPVMAESISLPQYNQLILPCVAANTQYLYFSRWRYKNQMLSYEAAPRKGGRHLPIRTVLDEAQLIRLQEEEWFRNLQISNAVEMNKALKTNMVENIVEHLVAEEANFADRFVYTEVKANLFAEGEHRLCLFNHTNDYLEWMRSDGESLRRVPIQYHRNKNWKSEILRDEVTGRFYTLMEHGRNTLVLEINTHDGTTSEYLLLEKAFVQKVKVSNGRFYFLYKDFAFSDHNLKLHRVG